MTIHCLFFFKRKPLLDFILFCHVSMNRIFQIIFREQYLMEMNRQKKKMQPPSSIPADRNFSFFQYQTNQTFSFSANC